MEHLLPCIVEIGNGWDELELGLGWLSESDSYCVCHLLLPSEKMDIFDGLHPQCVDSVDMEKSDTSEDSGDRFLGDVPRMLVGDAAKPHWIIMLIYLPQRSRVFSKW